MTPCTRLCQGMFGFRKENKQNNSRSSRAQDKHTKVFFFFSNSLFQYLSNVTIYSATNVSFQVMKIMEMTQYIFQPVKYLVAGHGSSGKVPE